jgi:hypothetical protein
MTTRPLELSCGAVLFAAFGLCTEIVFTGVKAWTGESFLGHVSLLMVPVYALTFLLLGPLLSAAERFRLGLRGYLPLAVLAIYAIEWSSGAFYRWLGFEPWHYDHGWASAFSGGNITLYYLPAWLVFALIVPPVWRIATAASPVVAAALRAEVAALRMPGREPREVAPARGREPALP